MALVGVVSREAAARLRGAQDQEGVRSAQGTAQQERAVPTAAVFSLEEGEGLEKGV